ncbi:MAG: hypothetical protein K8R58_01185 [Bacteroidales bacterium]|nr:hypothetical protein [Bacteroidales bacterium]
MIQYQSPIGEVILYNYWNREKISETNFVFKKIENLIDLIIYRTTTKGVNHTSSTLKDELFELRIEFLNLLNIKEEFFKKIDSFIIEEITSKYNQLENLGELGITYINCLETYFKVITPITNELIENFNEPNSLHELPSYQDFKSILSLIPGNEKNIFSDFVNSSLLFDYCLIVSELVFKEELKLSGSETKNLSMLLYSSIENFGIAAYNIGLWKPNFEDEEQIIRNIKIRLAVQETLKSDNMSYSLDYLKEHL